MTTANWKTPRIKIAECAAVLLQPDRALGPNSLRERLPRRAAYDELVGQHIDNARAVEAPIDTDRLTSLANACDGGDIRPIFLAGKHAFFYD